MLRHHVCRLLSPRNDRHRPFCERQRGCYKHSDSGTTCCQHVSRSYGTLLQAFVIDAQSDRLQNKEWLQHDKGILYADLI